MSLEKCPSYLVFLIILMILMCRTWSTIVLPPLEYEDGKFMLAYYFNNPGYLSVHVPYNGYVSYLPGLIAWFSSKLPLLWIPYALTFSALLLSTISFFLLSTKAIAWLIPRYDDRVLLAIVVALIPIGRGVLVNSVGYGQWSIGVILLVVVGWYPLSKSIAWLLIWFICASVLALSIPSSILYSPILLYQLLRNKEVWQRIFVAGALIVLGGYQYFWVGHEQKILINYEAITYSLKVFLLRVPFECLFGAKVATLLAANDEVLIPSLVGLLVLILLFFQAVKTEKPLSSLLILIGGFALAYSLVAVAIITRFVQPDERAIYLVQPHLQRYFLVPKVLIFMFLFWLIYPPVKRYMQGLRYRRLMNMVAVMWVVFHIYALNRDNQFLYESNQMESRRLHAFLSTVEKNITMKKSGMPYDAIHVFSRDQSWGFSLDIDSHDGDAKLPYPPKI